MSQKPRLGISACLLGENVRYDGQHKLDRYLVNTLGQFVEFVPVCPEVECGLPVPREAMRLVGDPEAPRLVTRNSGRDLTDQMLNWVGGRLDQLAGENLSGFIFKAKSPSSGMERVKVYNGRGGMSGRGRGLFAGAFIDRFPLLPVEDEGRLQDPGIRENFFERVFTLSRYREQVSGPKKARGLVQFHAEHKFLLTSHSQDLCRKMGRVVSSAGRLGASQFTDYEDLLLKTLKLRATPAKHVNVMQHMMGFMKDQLTHDEKIEMLDTLEAFRQDLVPLVVPITLLKHHVRKYGIEYLAHQLYLNPHPLELKLRNHA